MTPSYFHRKQKESRLNQQNFLAVQILTYDLHICDRSNLFLGFFLTYNHGQKSLEQSEHNFKSMHFTSSVAKSSAVFLQIHVPSPLPTQYNVERSKELCLDGFNTVCGVGEGNNCPKTFVHDCSSFLIFFFSDIQRKLRSEQSRKTDLVQCICCQILAFCCWVQTWWSMFTSRSFWRT